MKNNYVIYNKNLYLFCFLISFLCFSSPANADLTGMQQKYQELEDSLMNNIFALPVYIESKSEKESQHGDIYGIIYHPYSTIKSALTSPASWCDIIPQHPNIKACTYQHQSNLCQFTIYSGIQSYDEPKNTYKLEYNYSVTLQQENYFRSLLDAEDGPLGTYNYKIFIEAIPVNNHSTFIHFGYGFNHGALIRVAMKIYFSTFGRNRVGFTIIETNKENEPVYIGGIPAAIERNVICYYFAIQSYLDNIDVDHDKQLLARINRWFDLTEKYPRQLYEMKKEDYLQYKMAERENQLRLQKEINTEPVNCSQQTHNKINHLGTPAAFE